MLKTFILICQLSIPHSECTTETARAVLQGPDSIICGIPQGLLAATAIRAQEGEYYLFRCEAEVREAPELVLP